MIGSNKFGANDAALLLAVMGVIGIVGAIITCPDGFLCVPFTFALWISLGVFSIWFGLFLISTLGRK